MMSVELENIKRVLILSDSHDNLLAIRELFKSVNFSEIDLVMHCGDYISPFTFNLFIKKVFEEKKQFLSVLGNNEGEIFKIVEDFAEIKSSRKNLFIGKGSLEFKLNGLSGIILHGWGSSQEIKRIVRALGKSGEYKLLLYGHTHSPEIVAIDYSNRLEVLDNIRVDEAYVFPMDEIKSIILNPGELGGWLTGHQTYLIMEFQKKYLKVVLKDLKP